MASLDRTLADIEKKYGSRVARAFADAIRDLRDSVTLRRVIDALDAGDIQRALDAMNIESAVFANVRAELAAAYAQSGVALVSSVRFSPPTQTRAVVRFDVTNPVAERALREWLGQSITDITEATREAARTALSEGYAKGQGPRQIALDVVGRVGPNGRRTGGVLGLNQQQELHVRNMRDAMRNGWSKQSGEPAFWIKRDGTLGSSFSKRDRRFDRSILKLLRDGKSPNEAQINRWSGRYSDRLLKLRGDTIARTETAAAVEQGRFDGFRQGMDKQGIPYEYAIKEWRHGGGGMKPRVQHVAENETEVQGLLTPFRMPDGTLIQYPHAPDIPAKHSINCSCSLLIRVNWAKARADGVILSNS
ncbi:MAG: hypothetical protein GY820_41835 [Gammaproteobacteria bacterium]|nr:hypothetical protein [Gammaproteobacteria bacterium]